MSARQKEIRNAGYSNTYRDPGQRLDREERKLVCGDGEEANKLTENILAGRLAAMDRGCKANKEKPK